LIVAFPPDPKSDGMSFELSRRFQETFTEGMPGVSHLESMEEKLKALDLRQHEQTRYALHLVETVPGEEDRTAAFLYQCYALNTSPMGGALSGSFVVARNYEISIAGSSPAAPPISGNGYLFGPQWGRYQTMTGLPASNQAKPLRVMVVGIASDATIKKHSMKNLIDTKRSSVDDDNGHGTAVAVVIDQLAPGNEFMIYKAGDANGNVNEWDLLDALIADRGSHVVNLSVEYGLATRICGTCGRQSSSSRSAIFENITSATANWTNRPIIVAAAGNGTVSELAYPARFGSVVAVGSVNSSKRLAKESNYGDADLQGKIHQSHFVAPGGDSDSSNSEHVIELSNGKQYRGTSFAAAFVSAAVLVEAAKQGSYNYSSVLSNLKVDKNFNWWTDPEYGRGVIHV
jgi:Subtilase family